MHMLNMYNEFVYPFTNYFDPNKIKHRTSKSLTDLFASVSFVKY